MVSFLRTSQNPIVPDRGHGFFDHLLSIGPPMEQAFSREAGIGLVLANSIHDIMDPSSSCLQDATSPRPWGVKNPRIKQLTIAINKTCIFFIFPSWQIWPLLVFYLKSFFIDAMHISNCTLIWKFKARNPCSSVRVGIHYLKSRSIRPFLL